MSILDRMNLTGKVALVTGGAGDMGKAIAIQPVSYTHLRAHETPEHLVCRLLLEKQK